jgi:hypothetical protein
MTTKLKEAVKEAEKLPASDQDRIAEDLLEQVREKLKDVPSLSKEQAEPYSSFTVLREADFDLPEDYSVTYERALYGREADLDA